MTFYAILNHQTSTEWKSEIFVSGQRRKIRDVDLEIRKSSPANGICNVSISFWSRNMAEAFSEDVVVLIILA